MTDSNELRIGVLLDIISSSARDAMEEYKKTGHGVPGVDSTILHPLDLATDTLALRKAIMVLEGACHQLTTILAPPQHTIHNASADHNVAAKARIADVLDQHPEGLSVDVLADQVNLDKTKLIRVLRVLALKGCFKEVKQGIFANTRLSLILKSTNDPGCIVRVHSDFPKYGVNLYDAMIDQEYAKSHDVDKSPRLFSLRKEGINKDFWEMDDDTRKVFQRGMAGLTEIMGSSSVLHHYPWDTVSSMADIGSGVGANSILLSNMYPHLRITNQDLPGFVEQAQIAWEKDAPEALRDGRVEFVEFNFFEESPVVGKDVYYLRHVLHDWPDSESTTILRNIRKVMGPNSRVLIHDCVLFHPIEESGVETLEVNKAPEPMLLNFGAGNNTAYQIDMTMWLLFNGKERTLKELKAIGQVHFISECLAMIDSLRFTIHRASAGLAVTKVYDLAGSMAVEFRIVQD
ncbi:S-adenosyl-L-methionine-dependent methyltransferase [Suillus decipiens]|nr:S-adenosyl-L-methionine-dependent methyltransferase [Suillus decipiens]